MTSKNHGRKPVRYTGQHFLHDQSLINQIIDHGQINNNDVVLDIGAGKGALTGPLSARAERVIAIERDEQLVHHLKQSFTKKPGVKILGMNFRDMPLPNHPFKVVSNIPYAITTDIFGRLMDQPKTKFRNGVFLIQLGAARRFTEEPSSDPRIIGWNTWFDIHILRKVPQKAFTPPPTVSSAMVKICRRQKPIVSQNHYYGYLAFVAAMQNQRGIRAADALRLVFTRNQVRRIMADAKIPPDRAITFLTIPQWGYCFNVMKKLVPKRIHPAMPGKYKRLYR